MPLGLLGAARAMLVGPALPRVSKLLPSSSTDRNRFSVSLCIRALAASNRERFKLPENVLRGVYSRTCHGTLGQEGRLQAGSLEGNQKWPTTVRNLRAVVSASYLHICFNLSPPGFSEFASYLFDSHVWQFGNPWVIRCCGI